MGRNLAEPQHNCKRDIDGDLKRRLGDRLSQGSGCLGTLTRQVLGTCLWSASAFADAKVERSLGV
jgi:hypothetical protein